MEIWNGKSPKNFWRITVKVANENHAGNGEFLLIPKAEHGFAKVDSYRQVTELFSTGKYG